MIYFYLTHCTFNRLIFRFFGKKYYAVEAGA